MYRPWETLLKYIPDNTKMTGAEIANGSYATLSHNLLQNRKYITHYVIDNWANVKNTLSIVKTRMAQHGKRAIVRIQDTIEAASRIKNGSLDYLIINATSYDECYALLDAWTKKLAENGLLIVLDARNEEIKRCMIKVFKDINIDGALIYLHI